MGSDIAFIGLGNMGYGMCSNIRRKMPKDATLYVNDVNSAACDRFVEELKEFGPIEIVKTAKEAASRASTLLSMVPASKHVRQVYTDQENGVIAASKDANRLILECSTIDAATTRDVGKTITDAGLGNYIDAPVSGGVRGAASGNLAFMIGCADSDSQAGRIKDIVSMMGPPNKTFLCGQLGNGNAAKISNNYLSGTFLVAIAEAMAIGIRSGVDKNVLADVIRSSSGFSWTGEHLQPVPGINPDAPSSNGYKASFPHELIIKDVGLGVDAGNKIGIAPTMGDTALDAYRKASDDPRCKGKDFSSVYVYITDGDVDGQ